MSKRSKARRKRDKQGHQNRMILMGVIGLIAVGVVALTLSGTAGGAAAPEVEQARLDLDPVLGNPDAPVTIIEYGAYACPACRSWHQAGIVEQILAEYPEQVRFVFRDFPVISPAYDRMSANVAQCALDQGQEAFWAFHNALYDVVRVNSSQDALIQAGAQVGLNATALRVCAEANTHAATVQYDNNRARQLGLPGTPSWLVNDQRIFNASPDTLRAAIDQALRS